LKVEGSSPAPREEAGPRNRPDFKDRVMTAKPYRKKKPPILDDLDTQIIQELQKDARQSYLSLGQKIGASEGTVRNRVSMELKKELIKLKAVLNPAKLGFNLSCWVGLEVDIDKLGEAEAILAESPNVYFFIRLYWDL
jgi:DNA-binding Lrp family transcriptional regulator